MSSMTKWGKLYCLHWCPLYSVVTSLSKNRFIVVEQWTKERLWVELWIGSGVCHWTKEIKQWNGIYGKWRSGVWIKEWRSEIEYRTEWIGNVGFKAVWCVVVYEIEYGYGTKENNMPTDWSERLSGWISRAAEPISGVGNAAPLRYFLFRDSSFPCLSWPLMVTGASDFVYTRKPTTTLSPSFPGSWGEKIRDAPTSPP